MAKAPAAESAPSAEAATQEQILDGNVDPAPTPAPPPQSIKSPGEEAHYTPVPEDIPNEIPEKFMRDGKPDYDALTNSYLELEKMNGVKREELIEEAKKDLFKDRPESAEQYELPKESEFDLQELEGHPLYAWWKEEAFERGLSQEKFEEGIQQYAANVNGGYDQEAEIAKLGDHGKQRVAAVANWMQRFKDNPTVYGQLDRLAFTAEGIATIEAMMSNGGTPTVDTRAAPVQEITPDELRQMQSDPRYWDQTRRDPAFVAKVEEGYAKLYGDQ